MKKSHKIMVKYRKLIMFIIPFVLAGMIILDMWAKGFPLDRDFISTMTAMCIVAGIIFVKLSNLPNRRS